VNVEDSLVSPLQTEDAPACTELSRAVGWSSDLSHWSRAIRTGSPGSFCIRADGAIVATAVATTYGQTLSWVGMVITHPSYRRRSYARKLMNRLLAFVRESSVSTVMLDATEEGRPLYESMGFRALYRLEIWSRSPESPGPAGVAEQTAEIHEASREERRAVTGLDASLMGVRRDSVLEVLGGECLVSCDGTKVDGYLFVRPGPAELRIGPWHHRSFEGASALLDAALATAGPTGAVPCRIDIPAPNSFAREIARERGFTSSRFTTRMILGREPPGRMTEQYGIASFTTG